MSKNNGGPAFPSEGGRRFVIGNEVRKTLPSDGMTLRDYMAAKAMQGMLAHHAEYIGNVEQLSKDAYAAADAMLAERERDK